MILIGISWLFYWLLVDSFKLESLKAALITGVVFILVALAYENRDRFVKKI